MTDRLEILVASTHRRMRWRNGGGSTTEVATWPEQADWQWRLSIADIEQSGRFSEFPDVDRSIALVRGNGFALQIAGDPAAVIDRPYQTLEFRGDDPTSCDLLDGPVQALNLMVRRTAPPMQLGFIHTRDAAELTDWDFAVLLWGRLAIDDRHMSRLDAIRATPSKQPIALRSVDDEPAVVAVVSSR